MESDISRVKCMTAMEKYRKSHPKSIIFVFSKESKERETLFDYINVNLLDKEVTQNSWASFEIDIKESVLTSLSNPKQQKKEEKCQYTLLIAGKDYDRIAQKEKEKERELAMNSSRASSSTPRGTITHKINRPSGYFLVYDPMKKESFNKVQEILSQIVRHKKEPEEKTKDGNESNTPSRKQTKNFTEQKSFGALEPIILFSVIGESGEKEREVSYSEGKNLANENGILFYEISEENKDNINSACENIISIIEYNKRFENRN